MIDAFYEQANLQQQYQQDLANENDLPNRIILRPAIGKSRRRLREHPL